MQNNPQLSIVIPTKNRYATLFPVVDSLITYIESGDYEIIIHDNSDDNTIALQRYTLEKYPKVRYFHTYGNLSQTENSDAAIGYSKGNYIVFIGDDDLVSPFVMDAIKIMEQNKIDCLIQTPANYYWEGVRFANKTRVRVAESILIPKNINGNFTELHSSEVLTRVLKNGGVALENLPQLYHAFVSRKTLDKLKVKFGCYVPGPCPDMTLAVSLTYVLDKYYSIAYPFTITGVSKHSAAGLGAKNEHVGKLEDQKFLPKNIVEKWNPFLPKIWTACTIWAQSIFEVIRAAGDNKVINYTEFYARMLTRENYASDYVKPLLAEYLRENPNEIKRYKLALIKQYIKKYLIYVINIFIGGTPAIHNKLVKGIKTTDECMLYLTKIDRIK